MYSVKAQVINIFNVPASEKYEESYKVQLMGDTELKDGQIKKEMITLNVPLHVFTKLKEHVGKTVNLPISFYVSNNNLNPFFPKGATL